MKKSYWDLLKGENLLQSQVVKYLDYQYPNILYTHPQNEAKRSLWERFLCKALGMKSGVPDLLIFEKRQGHIGFAIELKYGNNTLTENQSKWLNDLFRRGWQTLYTNTFEEAKDEIDFYLTK